MIIYKDIISGDEILTDSYRIKEVHGVLLEVEGKLTTETTDIDDSKIGGNASAEAVPEDGGAEASSVSGINVVLANRLQEIPITKKDYKKYIKKFCAKIAERLKGSPRLDIFKNNGNDAVKKLLSIFDDAQFFIGENSSDYFDPDEENPCSVVVAIVEQDGKTAKLYYWKDGLEEEKA